MAVREVYAGGELDSVRVIAGSAAVSTTPLYRDTAYSDCSLVLQGNVYTSNFYDEDNVETTIPLGETAWVHLNLFSNTTASYLALLDTTGRPILRVARPSSSTSITLERNTGTAASPAWVVLASYGFSSYASFDVDFYFKTGSSKECGFYINNSLISTETFTDASVAALASFTAGPSTGDNFVSQILITENKPTVGAKVWTRKASGAGSVSGMSGVYTSLVKTALNDTTAIVSNAALQVSTFAYQDVTTPSGMVWGELWVWSRAKNDGSAPTGLNGIARVGGVNYSSPLMQGMGSGFNGLPVRWKNNPATSTKWTDATFNAAEFGMESVT